MKTQKTIYHILVDKSGSMSDCIDQTINGFNEQIAVKIPDPIRVLSLILIEPPKISTIFMSYIDQ